VFPVGEPQQELRGPVNRTFHSFNGWRGDDEISRQLRAKIARQIAHLPEISDSALVHPPDDLPRMKAGMSELGQRTLELGQFGFRDVDSDSSGHDGCRSSAGSKGEFSLYYVGDAGPLRRAVLNRT